MLSSTIPNCPKCGKPMVIKVAKKGPNAGSKFWGCPDFKSTGCRGTKDIVTFPIPSNYRQQTPVDNETYNLDLEPISVGERQRFYYQTDIDLNTNNTTQQVRLFQTVATYRTIVEQLNIEKLTLDRELVLGFSQWRLDFPKDRLELGREVKITLATLEKLFLRGSIIPPTPLVEEFMGNPPIEFATDTLVSLLKSAINPNRSLRLPTNFDSQAEMTFHHRLADYLLNSACISTQIPVACLTRGAVDPMSKQRVDFLLSYPQQKSIVIEVDGPHHAKLSLADQNRDKKLKEAGYSVIRIPVDKANQTSIDNYPEISKIKESIENERSSFTLMCGYDPNMLLRLRASSQLQLAILQAMQTGFLPLNVQSKWPISVISPECWKADDTWISIVTSAIRDIIQMVCQLYYFHHGENTVIDLSLRFEEPDSVSDIVFSFGDTNKSHPLPPNSFVISDCFLPIEISQPIPGSEPIIVEEPNKEIALYFFQYIFGKPEFRQKQWEAVERVVSHKDTILLLPTGHGKSMVFQLASFLLPGVCLVVDPLLSLIDDQIDNLGRQGIERAVGISSWLSQEERIAATDSFAKAHYHFCYVSPERFQIKEFRDGLQALVETKPISLIVIDEAHCVSEWGHDFRVPYLNIARNSRNFTKKAKYTPSLLAMTGTASRSVLRDMRRELEIMSPGAVISLENFDRQELFFKIVNCPTSEKFAKLETTLLEISRSYDDSSSFFDLKGKTTNGGLIFLPHVTGRMGAVKTYSYLEQAGYEGKIGVFSGKPPKNVSKTEWERRKQHEAHQFKNNGKSILVCTKSFGMGIDKENIRYTIHMNLPPSIEAAYQEAGRAGRDRERSMCYFIVSPDNQPRIRKLLDPNTSFEEVAQEMGKVKFDDDDITRQMYFHTKSFAGVDGEIKCAETILDSFGDLQAKKELVIEWLEDKTQMEKAIQRLLTVGVLEDYEVNHAREVINLRLSGNTASQNLESYLHYIENYDSKMAEKERREAVNSINLPLNDFVKYLLKRLIKNFIYGVIEQSRRRSLSEMLQACMGDATNESFRSRILSYFNFSQYTSIVDKSHNDKEFLQNNLESIVSELSTTLEAAELRGQVSRQLEAYPKSPPLLLLRSLSEALCSDRQEEVVFENFLAYLNFSSSAWGRKIEETITLAAKYINLIGETDPQLAKELVVATIEKYPDELTVLKTMLILLDPQFSTYIANCELRRIASVVSGLKTKENSS